MTNPIRLYLDEDTISRALIRALRARGSDVLTAQEADLIGATDDVQLGYATSQGRVIFTFNTVVCKKYDHNILPERIAHLLT